jgi:lipopolysaccharide export system permease protein
MTMVLYLSRQVGFRIVAVLLCLVALGVTFDLIEASTEILEDYDAKALGIYALLRAPLFLVIILPLGILIGAALAFLTLALRNEIVVLRIAGVNTLRIFLMLVPLAAVCGVGQSYLIGELAPAAEAALNRRFPEMFKTQGIEHEVWLRDWRDIIRVGRGTADGTRLSDVSIYQIDPNGDLRQRIEARTARYSRDGWRLEGVTLQAANQPKREVAELPWETRLTPAGLIGVARRPELIDAGEARQILSGAVPGGRGVPYYSVQLWRSYSAALVPLVMILFGTLAGFRLSREGGGKYIVLGISGGLSFIVFDGVLTSLGEVGAMGAVWAAFLAPGLFFVIGLWSVMVVEE